MLVPVRTSVDLCQHNKTMNCMNWKLMFVLCVKHREDLLAEVLNVSPSSELLLLLWRRVNARNVSSINLHMLINFQSVDTIYWKVPLFGKLYKSVMYCMYDMKMVCSDTRWDQYVKKWFFISKVKENWIKTVTFKNRK